MTRFNADLALKPEDRPAGKPQERIAAADLAKYKTEEQIQIEVAAWLDATLPKDWRWYHPPNGGWRKLATAKRLKAQGVKPGVPDVVILRPVGSPIYVELKSFGGVLSEAQKEFRDWCVATKQPYHVCRSVGEVIVFLKEFIARAA
jgi:hypothetical protein